jgi:hypothetical protein
LGGRDIQGNIRLLDAKGRSTTHTFAIGRRQTQQVSLTELLSKDGLEGEFGGVAIEPQNSPGNLQVLQFTLNQTTGLGALLKVFPKSVLAEKQFTIRASMVALAHPDSALALPAETRLQPRIFLYNSTEHPIIAHLLVDWHSATDWGRKRVPDLTIAPGATQILSLAESDEQQLGIPTTATWGSVEISYASDDGDLVALEASPSMDARYLVQTPFTDAMSFQFKGGAWMADADHTALITAGNAGTKPAKLDFKLWFGTPTPYEFPVKTLQPGEAITVNVGSIIASQQPDRNGKTIPPNVTSGTYEFSDLADPYIGYLYEGKQQIDKTYGLATYGCAFCCYYDYGWIATFTGHPGDSGPIPATGEEDCQNNYYDYDITSSVTGWASSNSNVATVSPGLAHAVGVGQASSSGSANLRSYQSYKSCPLALLAVAGFLQVTAPPTLTCSASVARGGTATCTVAPTGTTVTAWQFKDSSNNTVNRTQNVGSLTWQGVMVTSGMVNATVSGIPTPLAANVSVNNRTGFAFAAVSPTVESNGFAGDACSLNVPSPPTKTGDAVGQFCLSQNFSFETGIISDNGPNNGFSYVTSISNQNSTGTTAYFYVISPDLTNTSSAFYKAQCGNYNAQTNPNGFISGANLLTNTTRHESGTVQSHYENYVVAQNSSTNNLGTVAEGMVGLESAQNLATSVQSTLNQNVQTIKSATQVEPCSVQQDANCAFQGYVNFYPYTACN